MSAIENNPTTPTPEPLLSAEQVARWLGLTPNHVYDQAKHGKIPSIRIGRHRRFQRTVIESWLNTLGARAA
jgi:excisionase family DNA binding protein